MSGKSSFVILSLALLLLWGCSRPGMNADIPQQIQLPSLHPAATEQPEFQGNHIDIAMQSDGTLLQGRKTLRPDELESLLKRRTKKKRPTALRIAADRDVRFGELRRVLEIAKRHSIPTFLLAHSNDPQPRLLSRKVDIVTDQTWLESPYLVHLRVYPDFITLEGAQLSGKNAQAIFRRYGELSPKTIFPVTLGDDIPLGRLMDLISKGHAAGLSSFPLLPENVYIPVPVEIVEPLP